MIGPYSPEVANMDTDKLVQLGWHPQTGEEFGLRYAWRQVYHERIKTKSGRLMRIYHGVAAGLNSFLYGAEAQL